MTTTDLLTMSWHDRIRLVARNARRMLRTGAQTVLFTWGQDAAGEVGALDRLNLFDVDATTTVGAFLGGCLVWVVTTLAAPPRDQVTARSPIPPR